MMNVSLNHLDFSTGRKGTCVGVDDETFDTGVALANAVANIPTDAIGEHVFLDPTNSSRVFIIWRKTNI